MSDTKYIFVVREDKTDYSVPVYLGGDPKEDCDWGATFKLGEAFVCNTRKEAERFWITLSLALRSYRLTTIPGKELFEARLKGI